MSETKINDDNIFEGLYPDVFKKIDSADIQITPFQASKTFTVFSWLSIKVRLSFASIFSSLSKWLIVGGTILFLTDIIHAIDSITPAAPSKCPVIDFVELIFNE